MIAEETAIPGVLLLTPQRFTDDRGFFSETWNESRFAAAGIPGPFVQDNHVRSTDRGVVRGLHIQIGPNAQGKLIRAVRGSIWDVAVDIRPGSPTRGRHVGVVLSAENWQQLWIPAGLLHGYCTLEPDTEVIYKVTAPWIARQNAGSSGTTPSLPCPGPSVRRRQSPLRRIACCLASRIASGSVNNPYHGPVRPACHCA